MRMLFWAASVFPLAAPLPHAASSATEASRGRILTGVSFMVSGPSAPRDEALFDEAEQGVEGEAGQPGGEGAEHREAGLGVALGVAELAAEARGAVDGLGRGDRGVGDADGEPDGGEDLR